MQHLLLRTNSVNGSDANSIPIIRKVGNGGQELGIEFVTYCYLHSHSRVSTLPSVTRGVSSSQGSLDRPELP